MNDKNNAEASKEKTSHHFKTTLFCNVNGGLYQSFDTTRPRWYSLGWPKLLCSQNEVFFLVAKQPWAFSQLMLSKTFLTPSK